MSEQTSAVIAPGIWTAVRVDSDGSVVEAYNPGTTNIALTFTDDPDDTGKAADGTDYPPDGWRVRRREYNPAVNADLPGADYGQARWEADREIREAAERREREQRTALSLAAGHIEISGQDPDGTTHYRLTPAGARHAEQVFGLPPDTFPVGHSLLDR